MDGNKVQTDGNKVRMDGTNVRMDGPQKCRGVTKQGNTITSNEKMINGKNEST